MSIAFRTSWEGSTTLDLLRSSAGDLVLPSVTPREGHLAFLTIPRAWPLPCCASYWHSNVAVGFLRSQCCFVVGRCFHPAGAAGEKAGAEDIGV